MFKALLSRLRPCCGDSGTSGRRSASAYAIGLRLVICAQSQTRDGFFVDDGPRHVPDPADEAAVGDAILKALVESHQGLGAPRDFEAVHQPTLDAAGVGTRAFATQARLVLIEEGADTIRLTPTENRGAKEGFHARMELAIEAPPEPVAVSRAFNGALARSI